MYERSGEDRPGVDVDAVVHRVEHRRERHEDDHRGAVECELCERGGAELAVGVEDGDDDAADAHEHDDRNEHAEQLDGEVLGLLGELVVDDEVDEELTTDHREDGEGHENHEQYADDRARDAPGALLLAEFAQFGEGGHERTDERLVGDERADDVGNLEGDGERRGNRTDAEEVGRHALAHETDELGHERRDHHEDSRLAGAGRATTTRVCGGGCGGGSELRVGVGSGGGGAHSGRILPCAHV